MDFLDAFADCVALWRPTKVANCEALRVVGLTAELYSIDLLTGHAYPRDEIGTAIVDIVVPQPVLIRKRRNEVA